MIGEVFGRDAVYTVDSGNTSLWASLGLPSTRPGSYHSIMAFGMLGTTMGEVRWDIVAQGLGCLGRLLVTEGARRWLNPPAPPAAG